MSLTKEGIKEKKRKKDRGREREREAKSYGLLEGRGLPGSSNFLKNYTLLEAFCTELDEEIHCMCWWIGEGCCACGLGKDAAEPLERYIEDMEALA